MMGAPLVFDAPDAPYFDSKPMDEVAFPCDLLVARDGNGKIVAAHGSPLEGYRAWMEMSLEFGLYEMATDEVMEMAAAEVIAAQHSPGCAFAPIQASMPDPPTRTRVRAGDDGKPKPKKPRPTPPAPPRPPRPRPPRETWP
jgi:hypothetical protein